jgi:replicative DNA helicase
MAERNIPHSLDAETAVLGAILIDKDVVPLVLQYLSPDSFYLESHRRIFEATIRLFDKKKVVDLITMTDELKKRGHLDDVGGASYLASLQENVATTANVEYHAKIVLEKAVLRRLIDAGTKIVSHAYGAEEESDLILDRAEQLIFEIKEKRLKSGFTPISELVVPNISYFDELVRQKKLVTGVPSGFPDLDKYTSGFQPADLVIIAGRPSMGKTALVLNVAEWVAIHEQQPVAMFSLEMSKQLLVQRLLFSQAKVNAHRIRTGFGSEEDLVNLSEAAGLLRGAKIYIDDTPAIPILELRAKARRLKAEADFKLLIVDYLQLMQGPKTDTRQQEISEITRSLKSLAKELDVPVLTVSQLSRASEIRQDKRPVLSDLRESGAIEQDADVVIFIFRPEIYKKDSNLENIAEIIISKQRNGPTGTVKLTFLRNYAKFVSLTERAVEYTPEYELEGEK